MKSAKIKLLIFLFMIGIVKGFAYDIEVDGFYYNLDVPSLTATLVKGDRDYKGEIIIPESFLYGNREFNVTSIDGAFKNDNEVISVFVPQSITKITNEAFRDAGSLKSINGMSSLKEFGDYLFYGSTSLESIEINQRLKSFGKYTFANTAIEDFSLPELITRIPTGCFQNCNLLKQFSFNNVTEYIEDDAFRGCNSLENPDFPETLISIGDNAYRGCSNIKRVIIPGSVSYLGSAFNDVIHYMEFQYSPTPLNLIQCQFQDAYFLKILVDREINSSLSPGCINKTPFSPFYNNLGNTKINTVIFGNNVTKVGDYLFNLCTISYLYISKNIEMINKSSFSNNITVILENGTSHFNNIDVIKGSEYLYEGRKIERLEEYSNIGTKAIFSSINKSVITPKYTIRGYGLNSYHHKDEVIYIGENGTELSEGEKIIIGPNVSDFKTSDSQTSFQEIILLSTVPPSVTTFASSVYVNAIVKVPRGSLKAYQEDEKWGYFFNIEETDEYVDFNPWEIWCQDSLKDEENVNNYDDPDLISPQIIDNIPGKLSEISINNPRYLKIRGQINGSDILYLRSLMGSDSQADWRISTSTGLTSGNLTILDLSEAQIVSGGSPYYNYKTAPGSDIDEIRQGYRQNSLSTKDNVISDHMFNSCSSLKELWLPLDHSIDPDAFDNALNIQSLIVKDATPPTINGTGWKLTKICTVFVPNETLNLYESSEDWNFLPLKSQSEYIPLYTTLNKEGKIDFNNIFEIIELKMGDSLDLTQRYDYNILETITEVNNPLCMLTNGKGEFFAAYEGICYAVITRENNDIETSTTIKFVVSHGVDAESISLNIEKAELKIGETIQLEAIVLPEDTTDANITWTSSDEEVATINEEGLVTAISEGITIITASCGDVSATCEVTVVNPVIEVEEIILNISETSLNIDDTIQLQATVLPEDATDSTVIWNSSNEKVATVSEGGLVAAISEGWATITAACGNVTAECAITVLEDAGIESLIANPDSKISIYTTDGILIKKDSKAEDLKTLNKGIYIIVSGKERYKISN